MARCEDCKQEMKTAATCKVTHYEINGKDYQRVRYGHEGRFDVAGRCPDCGVRVAGYHHPGCDQEICPSCKRQNLMCEEED